MLGTINQPEIAESPMKKTLHFTVLFLVIATIGFYRDEGKMDG